MFAPMDAVLKADSPYSRFTNGASGRYVGAIVNRLGTIIGRVVAVAGTTLVVSTTPGRILPAGLPTPGKFAAALKAPLPPVGAPRTLVNGGAIALPVRPKFGPVPPTNGN